jgi:hypothetical protein
MALALGSASVAAAVQGGGPARLSVAGTLAWAMAAVAVLALVMARGHEIRLRASYATQSAWLRMNEADLRANYFGGQVKGRGQFAPEPEAAANSQPEAASDPESEPAEENAEQEPGA